MAKHPAHEHHMKAAEHHEHASKHHKEAATHHESGAHEKAAHHAHSAHAARGASCGGSGKTPCEPSREEIASRTTALVRAEIRPTFAAHVTPEGASAIRGLPAASAEIPDTPNAPSGPSIYFHGLRHV